MRFQIHLLTVPDPWDHHDNLVVACQMIVRQPLIRGTINGEIGAERIGLGFLGVCPACYKAVQADPKRYLYAIIEGQEALEASA